MQLFLTPVLVIRLCRRRHPCCPLGDQHGRTFLHLEIQPQLKPMPTWMTTLAALSAMILILISLGVRASAGAVGALMCPLRLFWDLTRLMRTSVLHVAANIHVPMCFRRVLHLSPSSAVCALCTTHRVSRFGVRNRATHVMTCPMHLPGRGVMCHIEKLWRPHELH